MDKIEHAIATAGFAIQDRAAELRPLVSEIKLSDLPQLVSWLPGLLKL